MLKKIYKMSASWCFPCKAYAPTFEKVSKLSEYKDIEFKELDADDDGEFFEEYLIRSVPTTLFIDENDKEILKINGNIPEKKLIDTINELL